MLFVVIGLYAFKTRYRAENSVTPNNNIYNLIVVKCNNQLKSIYLFIFFFVAPWLVKINLSILNLILSS